MSAEPEPSEQPQAEQPERPDVFISYSRKDRDFVRQLRDALSARGKEVWVDWEDIPKGSVWRDKINAGIEAAKAVVAVLSPDFIRSAPCDEEIAHAQRHNKRLVPLLHRPVDPPTVRSELADIDWVDFRDGFEAALDQLVTAVETDQAWVDEHARLTGRAREWEKAGKDRSLLLSGTDLRRSEQWYAQQDEHKERATQLQAEYLMASTQAARVRRRRIVLAVVSFVGIVAVGSAISLFLRHEAIARDHEARSRSLAGTARTQLASDPELALILASEAAHVAHTAEAERALRQAAFVARSRDELDLGVPVPLDRARLSPDKRYLVVFGADGSARAWDLRQRTSVPVLSALEAKETNGASDSATVSFSGNSRRAAVLDAAGNLHIRNLPSWREEAVWKGVGRATFTRDGALALVESSDFGGAPTLRRVPSRTVVKQFDGLSNAVLAPAGQTAAMTFGEDFPSDRIGPGIAVSRGPSWPDAQPLRGGWLREGSPLVFSLDGKLLAATEEHGLRVWTVGTGATLASLSTSDFPVTFSRDGKFLLTTDHRTFSNLGGQTVKRVWDVRRKTAVELHGHTADGLNDGQFSADGRRVLTAANDGNAIVWDVASGEALAILKGHRGRVLTAAFQGPTVVTVGTDGAARWWKVTPWEVVTRMPGSYVWLVNGRLGALGYDPAPGSFAVILWRGAINGKDVRWTSGKPFGNGLSDFAVQSNGRIVIAGERGATILDPERGGTGEKVRSDQDAENSLSTDGEHLLSMTTNRIVVRSLPDGTVELDRRAPSGSPHVLAVSAGARFAVLGRGLLRAEILDLRKDAGIEIQDVSAARFSRDGQRLVMWRSGGLARIFESETGRPIAELRGHEGNIVSAEFSSDGELVLTAGIDGTVRLWDAQTGDALGLLRTGLRKAVPAQFAQDGRRIVVSGDAVRIAPCLACLPYNGLLDAVEKMPLRTLDPAERRRFLGD